MTQPKLFLNDVSAIYSVPDGEYQNVYIYDPDDWFYEVPKDFFGEPGVFKIDNGMKLQDINTCPVDLSSDTE
jgi:hypothetical protein